MITTEEAERIDGEFEEAFAIETVRYQTGGQ